MASIGFLNKVVGLLATIITVPLVLESMGESRFSLWMFFATLIAIARVCDGGISAGLMTLVAQSSGLDGRKRIASLGSTALAMSSLVCLLMFCVSVLVLYIDWKSILNTENAELVDEARVVALIIVASSGANFIAGSYKMMRIGLQHGPQVGVWDFASALSVLLGQVIAIKAGFGLIGLAIATMCIPVVINILLSINFCLGIGKVFSFKFSSIRKDYITLLFRTGIFFTLLSAVQFSANQLDIYIIVQILGLEAVASYSLLQKIFIQPQFIATLAMSAMFPAIGEALLKGDFKWVSIGMGRILSLAFIGGPVLCVVLYFAAGSIISVWASPQLVPDKLLILVMSLFGFFSILSCIVSYFFYSIGSYKKVVKFYSFMTIVNIPTTVVLVNYFGVVGAASASCFSLLTCVVYPGIRDLRNTLSDLEPIRRRQIGVLH